MLYAAIIFLRNGVSDRFFFSFFFFNDTPPTEIYTSLHTLSLHDALPIYRSTRSRPGRTRSPGRTRARGRSEEHTSELQSRNDISYAVFCLKKKKKTKEKRWTSHNT